MSSETDWFGGGWEDPLESWPTWQACSGTRPGNVPGTPFGRGVATSTGTTTLGNRHSADAMTPN